MRVSFQFQQSALLLEEWGRFVSLSRRRRGTSNIAFQNALARSLARSVFPFEWWRSFSRPPARGVAAKGRVVFYLDNSNEIFARREKEVWLTETETGKDGFVRSARARIEMALRPSALRPRPPTLTGQFYGRGRGRRLRPSRSFICLSHLLSSPRDERRLRRPEERVRHP